MKAKLLFIAAVCCVLPIFTGCGNNSGNDLQNGTDINYEQNESEDVGGQGTDETIVETDDGSEIAVMYITINNNKLEVELEDNSSVAALLEILRQNDITYTATDYGNFEKVGNIGYTLPDNDEEITTQPGDVILYQGSSICLYYVTN
ncbi:MAG: hypothetical protein LUD19_05335, partial [Clostridia bacterium]|nr:hypothetical protein [Clostridia bacterium]